MGWLPEASSVMSLIASAADLGFMCMWIHVFLLIKKNDLAPPSRVEEFK